MFLGVFTFSTRGLLLMTCVRALDALVAQPHILNFGQISVAGVDEDVLPQSPSHNKCSQIQILSNSFYSRSFVNSGFLLSCCVQSLTSCILCHTCRSQLSVVYWLLWFLLTEAVTVFWVLSGYHVSQSGFLLVQTVPHHVEPCFINLHRTGQRFTWSDVGTHTLEVELWGLCF